MDKTAVAPRAAYHRPVLHHHAQPGHRPGRRGQHGAHLKKKGLGLVSRRSMPTPSDNWLKTNPGNNFTSGA